MFRPIRLLVIISVLKVTVLGDVSKISDVQACTEFCSASGNVGTFQNGNCTCANVDKDSENVLREYRQVEYIDPNLYSKDLTDEERIARCTLGSTKKRLGHHDAERVVKYFINDGPLAGHSYFLGASNQNDNVDGECENKKNPLANLYVNADKPNNPIADHQGLESIGQNYYQPDYNDAIVGAYNPYDPIYLLPQEVPVASVAINPYEHVIDSTYGPVVGSNNYILNQPIDTVQATPRERLLAAKSARRTVRPPRPRLNTLKGLSNTLLGLVKEPIHQGLLGARSFFHNLVTPDPTVYSPRYISDLNMVGRSNIENIIPEADPIVGTEDENSQTPEVNSETGSQNNTQKSSDLRKPTNSVPLTQRANIPAGTFQNIPYNQQYFMPIYPSQQNPAFFNSMPRAYILQPVQIMPQTIRSASPSEITGSSKQHDSSNCENKSSVSEDNDMESANATTQKPEEETNLNGVDSVITKRNSNKQKH